MISRAVHIEVGDESIAGDLVVPPAAGGLVVFAHGSGSSRHSPRNREVAATLHAEGLGTLLIDLLTLDEEAADVQTGRHRFDIDLLAGRLVAAIDWAGAAPETSSLPIACFGASTGAAAALLAAAHRPEVVRTVVSRGGRPDLAGDALHKVSCPTLLVVGGEDHTVVDLNRRAAAKLGGPTTVEVVPGATHLFSEPGALETVARLAAAWCTERLRTPTDWR